MLVLPITRDEEVGGIEPLSRPQLHPRRIQAGDFIQHDMPLPIRFVQDQRPHHTPRSPQSLPEILSRFILCSPTFQTCRNDSRDHDDGVFGSDSLGSSVQTDGEGIVIDRFFLSGLELSNHLVNISLGKPDISPISL